MSAPATGSEESASGKAKASLFFPFCQEITKYEKMAKIGEGTFGYVIFQVCFKRSAKAKAKCVVASRRNTTIILCKGWICYYQYLYKSCFLQLHKYVELTSIIKSLLF